MPGCVNGMCRKEFVNGIEVEIAQTCECERFPATHVLTDSTYKYTGPRCDQRKFEIFEIFEIAFLEKSTIDILHFSKYCPLYSNCVQFQPFAYLLAKMAACALWLETPTLPLQQVDIVMLEHARKYSNEKILKL